jgi:hypothetical protein
MRNLLTSRPPFNIASRIMRVGSVQLLADVVFVSATWKDHGVGPFSCIYELVI